MSIEELRTLLAPPSAPDCSSGDWEEVEGSLGLRFPADYREFISTYGSGTTGFLWVASPFSPERINGIPTAMAALLERQRELRESGMIDHPYAIYPEPGGLFPWGGTDNGDDLFWVTSKDGRPESWPVLIHATRDSEVEEHATGMVGFISQAISGQLQSELIPSNAFRRPARFFNRDEVAQGLHEG